MIHDQDEQDEPGEEKGFEEPPEFVKGEPNLREEEYRPYGKYKDDDPEQRNIHPEEDTESRRWRIEREEREKRLGPERGPERDPRV